MNDSRNIQCDFCISIVDALSRESINNPDKDAFIFLDYHTNDIIKEKKITYGQLVKQAQVIASWFGEHGNKWDRAIILSPPGLDFITSFFGCLYAGIIAVPVYPPINPRLYGRFESIIADSGATFAISETSFYNTALKNIDSDSKLARLKWLLYDSLADRPVDYHDNARPSSSDTAFIQYTSGSTALPKGVVISHRNISHNLFVIKNKFELSDSDIGVIWLPFYHDMGLIGGIMSTVYNGMSSVLMSPLDFIMDPYRWLKAVSDYHATISGGPNFAYELCVKKISPDQMAKLDLSDWHLAFNGAEPIRAETIDRFSMKFARCNFKRNAFYPCYGLAESTLMVTGNKRGKEPNVQYLDSELLMINRAIDLQHGGKSTTSLVSSGKPDESVKIIIANPHSMTRCKENEVGEIWVSSASVSEGYWMKTNPESDDIFRAYLSDTGEGPFLRTGDLGFIKHDELFITGRMKDIIIVRGKNYYPQDIEQAVENCHPSFRTGCSAAFSVPVDGKEEVGIIQEIKEGSFHEKDIDALFETVRKTIFQSFGLDVNGVVFIKSGTIPKTSSGKIQRHLCKEKFFNGDLEVLSEWKKEKANPPDNGPALIDSLRFELSQIVAAILDVPAAEIDFEAPLDEYGFDSITVIEFTKRMNDSFNLDLTPAVFFELEPPTLGSLSIHLASEHAQNLRVRHGTHSTRVTAKKTKDSVSHAAQNSCVAASPMAIRYPRDAGAQEPIAIIGMSALMPGSADIDSFWEHLCDKRNLTSEVPRERWDWRECCDTGLHDSEKNLARWGAFIEDIDKFDAQFFGISPREAALIDPQHRIFLELVWKVIEDSGYRASELSGSRTGLFVGVSTFDYLDILKSNMADFDPHASTGMAHSILVNRISYFLNLRGPSEPINTACSSSLYAIHRGVESIRSGSCTMAICGGINLMLSPNLHIAFSRAGMLASDGLCKTFDKNADGYVRGEGAGAVLLKPLRRAEADHDNIYAVIKGSAVNHCGRTKSLTAPSANAQAEVLIQAYENAGVDPWRVSYIEAHGTGTSLGDPVEINGLKKAFKHFSDIQGKSWSCGIGSVKTNIGHLEAAAGMAGIIKVILSMNHGKIPASINFNELNPHIRLDDSPFYIVDETMPWKLSEGAGSLCAGVSSFGFGGANAHVVLESYPRFAGEPIAQGMEEYTIVLSAKNEMRLKAYAEAFCTHLKKDRYKHRLNLPDIAYTLHAGREAFQYRLALVVSSIEELTVKLDLYCRGNDFIENLFTGDAKKNTSNMHDLFEGESGNVITDIILANKGVRRLAQLWASGIDIDWNILYRHNKHYRVSLPTYPFEKQRHWVEKMQPDVTIPFYDKNRIPGSLHPFIESNESSLEGIRYKKSIGAGDKYLSYDVINSCSIVPGSFFVEMARAAGSLAKRNSPVSKIKNFIWAESLAIAEGRQDLYISLYPNRAAVDFEIYTLDAANTQHPYAQGTLIFKDKNDKAADAERLLLDEIMRRTEKITIDAAENARFNFNSHKHHLADGSFRDLYISASEALVRIELKGKHDKELSPVELNPLVLECALRSINPIVSAYADASSMKFWPVIADSIEIIQPMTDICYAHVTLTKCGCSADLTRLNFNISITDQAGTVLLKIHDYAVRIKDIRIHHYMTELASSDLLFYNTEWEPSPLQMGSSKIPEKRSGGDQRESIIIFDTNIELSNALEKRFGTRDTHHKRPVSVKPGKQYKQVSADAYEINPEREEDYDSLIASVTESGAVSAIIYNWAHHKPAVTTRNIGRLLTDGIHSLCLLTKALMRHGFNETLKLFYIVPSSAHTVASSSRKGTHAISTYPLYAAINAFSKTVSMESPNLEYKTLEYELTSSKQDISPSVYLSEILYDEILHAPADQSSIRYENRRRFVKIFRKFNPEERGQSTQISTDTGLLRSGGTYLITGGSGGLGYIFAEYLAKTKKAAIILSGRSKINPEIRSKLGSLNKYGSSAAYIQSDISNRADTEKLITKIKSEYRHINGIFHCAGVVRDTPIIFKTTDGMREVYAPKIYGAMHLDEMTKDDSLDCFIMFSSVSGALGNPGQSDYAYANNFLDHFAICREKLREQGKRSGKTISINWPLWSEGGMRIDSGRVALLRETVGLEPLETEIGLRAFESIAGSCCTNAIVAFGDPQKIDRFLNIDNDIASDHRKTLPRRTVCIKRTPDRPVKRQDPVEDSTIETSRSKENVAEFLRETIVSIAHIPADSIDERLELHELGIDSIMGMRIIRAIERKLGLRIYANELLKNNTLEKLARYLEKQQENSGETSCNDSSGKTKKNKAGSLGFLLSTPRAGSTLLRVMLMGNEEIFSPPELHLLPFDSLYERKLSLEQDGKGFLREGLIETIKELEGTTTSDAIQKMNSMESDNLSTRSTYAYLLDRVTRKYIIDKSPSYASDIHTLKRAEQICENPYYIFLVRHPLSVMESFARNRFEKLLGFDENPWLVAENLWQTMNRNIKDFLSAVPRHRWTTILFERLVQEPENEMRRLCQKMEIEYHPAMIRPYEGSRMTGGLHEDSISIGDPNFLQHDAIDPGLASSWMSQLDKADSLSQETVELALELGYTRDMFVRKKQKQKRHSQRKTPLRNEDARINGPIYDLSQQQRLIFRRIGHDPFWGIVHQFTFTLENELDRDRFNDSLNKIIRKHAVLRRYFIKTNEEWVQHEASEAEVRVEYEDLSGLEAEVQENKLHEIEESLTNKEKTDVGSPPLLACSVTSRGCKQYTAIIAIHMLLSDGWTVMLLLRDLFNFYSASANSVISADKRYEDYVREMTRVEKNGVPEKHYNFWKKHTRGKPARYPIDFNRGDDIVSSEQVYISKERFEGYDFNDDEFRGTLFISLSLGLYRHLSHTANHANPVIAHRLHRRGVKLEHDYSDVVGRFAGDIPLRFSIKPEASVRDQVRDFQGLMRQIPMDGLTYDMLVNQGKIPGANETCSVMFNYQPVSIFTKYAVDSKSRQFESPSNKRFYQMEAIVRERDDHIIVIVKYSNNNYKAGSIKKFVQGWMNETTRVISDTIKK